MKETKKTFIPLTYVNTLGGTPFSGFTNRQKTSFGKSHSRFLPILLDMAKLSDLYSPSREKLIVSILKEMDKRGSYISTIRDAAKNHKCSLKTVQEVISFLIGVNFLFKKAQSVYVLDSYFQGAAEKGIVLRYTDQVDATPDNQMDAFPEHSKPPN